MADVVSAVESAAKGVAHAVEKAAHVAHEAEVVVSEAFVKLVGKDQAHAFAQAAAQVLKSEAGNLALDAVQVLEAVRPALDGAAKRAQAEAKLSADLKAAESNIPSSLINLLIEAAVAAVKGYIQLP